MTALLVRRFWLSPSRHYSACLEQDLLGYLLLRQRWGVRGSRRGGFMARPTQSLEQGIEALEAVGRRRAQHGYQETSL